MNLYARKIMTDYFQRRNQPPDSTLDGLYQYEMAVLRDTLERLEVILADEGVPPNTAERVIRCMLYGSPSPVAAEERMRRDRETADMLSREPATMYVKPQQFADLAAELGMPPEAAP